MKLLRKLFCKFKLHSYEVYYELGENLLKHVYVKKKRCKKCGKAGK